MANVFSQAKDLFKMQQEAKNMQNKMKQIIVSGFSKNELVEVRLNGANELEKIEIDPQMLDANKKFQIEKAIMEAFKEASKKLQKELMKDFDLDKVKSFLGV